MGRRLLLQWLVLRSQPLPSPGEPTNAVCGISAPFGTLSPAEGQIIYVLRTRAPLSGLLPLVRLACVRRAANVRSEPGSNSPVIKTFERIDLAVAVSRGLQARDLDRFPLALRGSFTAAARCVSLRFSFQRPKPCPRERLRRSSSGSGEPPLVRGGPLFSCPFATVNRVSNLFSRPVLGHSALRCGGHEIRSQHLKIRDDFGIFSPPKRSR
jgi:hypothetical protein